MSPEALAKPIITSNSPAFKLDVYASIPAGELVVFAVQLVQADAAPVAVEEVVSTCFRLFPHSFSLKNYFYWPDSALVIRRLHDAKEKGFLKGSPAEGFEVKGRGTQLAKRIAKVLGVTLPTPFKVEQPEPLKVEVEQAKEVPVSVKVETPTVKQPEEQLSLLPPLKEEARKKEPVKHAAKVVKEKSVTKKKTQKPKKATLSRTAKTKEAAKPVIAAPKKKSTEKPAPKKKAPAKTKVTSLPEKKAIAPAPKKPVSSAVKKKVTERERVATAPTKKVTAKKAAPPAPVKKAPKKKALTPKVSTPKVEKKTPAPKKETPQPKPKTAQPAQLTMALPTPPAKKTAEGPATKPSVKKEAKPVKQEAAPIPQVQVSKEEKDKAGKFVKLMERSDAFQQYKKNSGKAKISEFDFRNMLYATMESSAETLKRNVDLFKRYAVIHNRADLVTFLTYCEDSFAPLLVPQVKRTTRK